MQASFSTSHCATEENEKEMSCYLIKCATTECGSWDSADSVLMLGVYYPYEGSQTQTKDQFDHVCKHIQV